MKAGADNNYYIHYNLSRDPFPVTATTEKKLFISHDLGQKLHELKSLIQESEKIVAVTAPVGGGKTSLINQIELLKASNWKTSIVRGNSSTSIDLLAYNIARQASQDKTPDPRPPVSQVHKYLEQCANNKIIPVVIVDDAHMLPDKTLEFVLQLAELRYGESLFRIILLAEPSIERRLADPKFADLVHGLIESISLPPVSKENIRNYVEHNLARYGTISEYPFIDEDFDYIYEQSAGLPKAINLAARQIMQERISKDSMLSPYRWPIIGFGLAALIGIVAYFLYHNPSVQVARPQKPVAAQTAEPEAREKTESEAAPITEAPVTAEIAENAPEEIHQGTISTEVVPTSETLPEPVVTETISEPVEIAEPVSVEQETPASPVTEVTADIAAGPAPVVEPEPSPPAIEPVYDAANIFKLDTVPDYVQGIRGEDWLRQQPAGAYALQLISASDLANIEKLLAGQSGFVDQLSGYVKYTPSGKPRYLLLYGQYPDKETAQIAIQGMPEQFQSVNPWPRSIGDVVQEIDQVGTRR